MPKVNGKTASGTRYLPCQAEPGMFRGELLVYLDGLNPEQAGQRIKVQLLVDERDVLGLDRAPQRNSPATGWLQVSLAHQEGELAEVVLPQPAQPVGESLLVDAKALKKSPA